MPDLFNQLFQQVFVPDLGIVLPKEDGTLLHGFGGHPVPTLCEALPQPLFVEYALAAGKKSFRVLPVSVALPQFFGLYVQMSSDVLRVVPVVVYCGHRYVSPITDDVYDL